MAITSKDLSELAKGIIEAVDFRLNKMETHFDMRFSSLENRVSDIEKSISRLATTLDNFIKMMTDYKEEFVILKSEVDQIKKILKDKLGIKTIHILYPCRVS